MGRRKVVVVEGPQGAGKTSITNWLREQMLSTILMRLTGVADKSSLGEIKAFKYHYAILDAIAKSDQCDVNYVLDRSFVTEYVYAQLGYKPYTFNDRFKELCDLLEKRVAVNYDVIFINLYLGDTNDFVDRLNRDKAEYQKFNIGNSIAQQYKYADVVDEMANRCPNVGFYNIDTTHQDYWMEIADIVGFIPKGTLDYIKIEMKMGGGNGNE